jgi:Tfp pilus assembly protein PilV
MLQHAVKVRAAQRGFTLIELMYATGYFMIGLVGLTCFQLVAAHGTQHASDITLATQITSNLLETSRATAFQTVLGMPQPQQSVYDRYGTRDGTPTYFTATATATAQSGVAYYELVVSTTWRMRPGDTFVHGISMQTRVATE